MSDERQITMLDAPPAPSYVPPARLQMPWWEADFRNRREARRDPRRRLYLQLEGILWLGQLPGASPLTVARWAHHHRSGLSAPPPPPADMGRGFRRLLRALRAADVILRRLEEVER